MFAAASSALRESALNPKFLGGIIGLTAVLHTQNRFLIPERNIVSHQNGEITFSYINSRTGDRETRTLPGKQFVRLVLQHLFVRVAGNRPSLSQSQCLDHVLINEVAHRPVFKIKRSRKTSVDAIFKSVTFNICRDSCALREKLNIY